MAFFFPHLFLFGAYAPLQRWETYVWETYVWTRINRMNARDMPGWVAGPLPSRTTTTAL